MDNTGKPKKEEKTKNKVKNSQPEIEEWKNKYLRALADYQNLEKRTALQMGEVRNRAGRDILLKFLNILDSIDKAEIFIKDPGMALVKDQFISLLKSEGIEEINVLDTEFDPYVAECVQVVEGEKDSIVTEVVQKGYRQGENVIRPAKVKVTKKA